MENLTLEEATSNVTKEEFKKWGENRTWSVFESAIFLSVSIANILACTLTLCIVCRFKKMRSKRDLTIAYWSVIALLYNIIHPGAVQSFSILFDVPLDDDTHNCFLLQYCQLMSAATIAMFHLSLNSYVATVANRKYKLTLIATTLFLAANSMFNSYSCYDDLDAALGNLLTLFGMFLLLLGRSCVYLYNKLKKRLTKDEDFRMIIVSLFLLHCLIILVDLGIVSGLRSMIAFVYFNTFIICLNELHPVLNAYMLYRLNDDYKLYFRNVLKCRSQKTVKNGENDKELVQNECPLMTKEKPTETEDA